MSSCFSGKNKISLGSLNELITINTRKIVPPSHQTINDVDFNEEFTDSLTVFSRIRTKTGKAVFDQVGEEKIMSHEFVIRSILDLTKEAWIVYLDNRYAILTIEDINEDLRFMKLRCIFRGSIDKKASKA